MIILKLFKLFSSLYQALDLMMDDDSTLQYNATFESDKVMDFMRNTLYEEFRSEDGRHIGSWRGKFLIKLATVLTRFGFCYSFNIGEPEDILRLEK